MADFGFTLQNKWKKPSRFVSVCSHPSGKELINLINILNIYWIYWIVQLFFSSTCCWIFKLQCPPSHRSPGLSRQSLVPRGAGGLMSRKIEQMWMIKKGVPGVPPWLRKPPYVYHKTKTVGFHPKIWWFHPKKISTIIYLGLWDFTQKFSTSLRTVSQTEARLRCSANQAPAWSICGKW